MVWHENIYQTINQWYDKVKSFSHTLILPKKYFVVVDVAANGGDYNQMIRTEGVLMQVSYTCKAAYMYMHHTIIQTYKIYIFPLTDFILHK